MARPHRINKENCFYHIYNRGISRKTICFNDYHFFIFLELMKEIKSKYEVGIHSYCMMQNHYHILLKTKDANLSDAMWYFGKNFSQRINKDINGDGPLFRNRFKSIPVENEKYLLQLSRYIHLNPSEAELVKKAEHYDWSSCKYFLDLDHHNRDAFVEKKIILSQFKSKLEYLDFLNLGNSKSFTKFYKRKNVLSVLSDDTLK